MLPETESKPPRDIISILGTNVSQIDMPTAVRQIEHLVASPTSHYVCVPDVFQIVYAYDHPGHRAILNNASIVTPDGTPLVWVSRLRGSKSISRVAGPDLLPAVCEVSASKGWRHYFYGGAEGVAEELALRLSKAFPGLAIAGAECPPFRRLTDEEDAEALRRINGSNANIVWVGLGCPKQEIWMAEHVNQIDNAVLIGVGAAFDFFTDRIPRAPSWMHSNGLEWLYRLISEPRRLWRRYLFSAPRFIYLTARESLWHWPDSRGKPGDE